jgi:hypothetical protein
VGQLIRKLSLAYLHAAKMHVHTDTMYTTRCIDEIIKGNMHRIQLVLLLNSLATAILVFYNIHTEFLEKC